MFLYCYMVFDWYFIGYSMYATPFLGYISIFIGNRKKFTFSNLAHFLVNSDILGIGNWNCSHIHGILSSLIMLLCV